MSGQFGTQGETILIDEISPIRPSVKLGNLWLTAATLALSTLVAESKLPAVVLINQHGDLVALQPDHPDYATRLLDQGFVCTLSQGSDVARIAARMREAAMATWVNDE